MRAWPALLVLAAGCAGPAPSAAPAAAGSPWEGPPVAEPGQGASFARTIVHADRVRLVVPSARAAELLRGRWAGRPAARLPGDHSIANPDLVVVVPREGALTVEVGGEDLTILAEGVEAMVNQSLGCSVIGGPYRTLVWKNGRMITR